MGRFSFGQPERYRIHSRPSGSTADDDFIPISPQKSIERVYDGSIPSSPQRSIERVGAVDTAAHMTIQHVAPEKTEQ